MKKIVSTPDYNYVFDMEDGTFLRWGSTIEEDPVMSPLGCEIADIEISTKCHGVGGKVCKMCYKNNVPTGKNMSLETFKKVFANLPDNLTQIAFGIGDIDSNPEMWNIFKHCRENGIVPNVTINGDRMTGDDITGLVNYCGAVAVSRYSPKDVCYDAVNVLTDAGLEQVNIHMLLSEETYDDCIELIHDVNNDERLEKLNAVVFLSLKQKGRGVSLTRLGEKKFAHLMSILDGAGINYGFDSCTAHKFLRNVSDEKRKRVEQFIEPCESGLFSIYINVDGVVYPCSFTEVGEGIDMLSVNDFVDDVWYSDVISDWRKGLLACNRECPVYKI